MVDVKVPQEGQYGLDIFARENWETEIVRFPLVAFLENPSLLVVIHFQVKLFEQALPQCMLKFDLKISDNLKKISNPLCQIDSCSSRGLATASTRLAVVA